MSITVLKSPNKTRNLQSLSSKVTASLVPLDFCPDLLSHHDASGIFLYASASAQSILGADPNTLRGKSILDIPCEADCARFVAAWQSAVATSTAQRIRFDVVVNGQIKHLETSLRVVTNGEATGTAVCITRDIGDVVNAELGKTQWEQLVAQTPGIVWHAPIRPDGTRGSAEFISDYLERVVGYTAHEWLTTPNFWSSIIHPEDLERTLQATARCLADGTPAPPYRVRTKNGNTIFFQSYMRVLRDATGKPERLYGLTLDVTTFKETEAANAALLAEVLALSAPVIPVRKDVIVVPLIGVLDEMRANRLLLSLLDGVSRHNAHVAILDLTGVPSLDAAGAKGLVNAARAARLLGARAILTGLSAAAARLIVSLGLSLEDLPTRPTLLRALEDLRNDS